MSLSRPLCWLFACSFLLVTTTQCSSAKKLTSVSKYATAPIRAAQDLVPSFSSDDPEVPYKVGQKLEPGHTLDVTVYRGLYSPKKLLSNRLIIDPEGQIDLGKTGQLNIVGLTAEQATQAIKSAFLQSRGERIIQVHLHAIEDLKLIKLQGSVKTPAHIAWFDDADIESALPYVGGLQMQDSNVYVFHEGRRRFFRDLTAAKANGTLHPGDIIEFSRDF